MPEIPIPVVWQSVIAAALVLGALAGYLVRFSSNRLWIALAVAVLVADQASKRTIERLAIGPEGLRLLGGAVRLLYLENPGLGFGSVFADMLLATACFVLLALVLYSRLSRLGYRMSASAEAAGGLLVGSLLGVAVDRACLGYVVDFIIMGDGSYVYNIADLAGVAAGVVFAARLLRLAVRHARTPLGSPGPGWQSKT